jgi:predicted DNA-binding transcriptional regulator YafY
MSNMHRLNWIDAQIRQKLFPNCVSMAEQFSISPRQAARDLEYLRDSMGAPVEYCYRRKGYYYTRDTFVLGNILVTDQQRQGLSYLAEQYAKLESEHARHLSRLFRRLIDYSSTEEADIALPLFPIDPVELSIFDKINKSIEAYNKVDITYADAQGSAKAVRLSPYKIYSYQHENFVVGYCEPGKQIRFFALSGLLSVEVSNFKFDLTPLLKQAEIVPELTNEANIAYVRLDAPSYAGSFPFHFVAINTGLYRVEYYDPHRLLAALFASPIETTIESPKWLRNLYANILEKKLRRILENDTICQSTPVKMENKKTERSKLIPMG